MVASNAKRNQVAGFAILGKALSSLICMPKRYFILINVFECYFADAEPLFIDATEQAIVRPSDKAQQKSCYSGKKKTTAKSNDYFNGIENNNVY
ncbi:MAG: hypothetical protein Q8N30_10055 [Methylococcales bacterium]|nr:hypothetical protein [Methylococcales bacterium]